MNLMRSSIPFAFAILLAACSTPPQPVEAPVAETPPQRPPVVAVTPPPPPAVPAPAPRAAIQPDHLDPNSPVARNRSIFFDYDDFGLSAEDRAIVELQAGYLAKHPELAVRVEGNADERGSAEYNLALGSKRAEAVQRALRLLGVKDSQVEAISWGEEKPRAVAHDEASWAQNRRVDIVYPSR